MTNDFWVGEIHSGSRQGPFGAHMAPPFGRPRAPL